MFKRLSILTVFALGVSILLTSSTVYAQRGGFGRGGFGRGGFGGGGGHPSGHSGSASVRVNSGTFFPPQFRTGPDGRFSNNFGPRHGNPITGKFGFRSPFFFGHGFPFGFTLTQGFPFGVSQFNSGLGSPIPPIVSPVSNGVPFFFGVPLGPRPVFRTVVDLGTINPITPVNIDCARTSNVTIVNIPANAFRRANH
jgi:hypothetical protein